MGSGPSRSAPIGGSGASADARLRPSAARRSRRSCRAFSTAASSAAAPPEELLRLKLQMPEFLRALGLKSLRFEAAGASGETATADTLPPRSSGRGERAVGCVLAAGGGGGRASESCLSSKGT
ncbi:hypothetical protein EMIHUDRAFT_353562 [Emiliania huxleyi CCMP1516]|uniref:Uncharacterized protein n=2 Tax=Emiliania huxleyi TaxID=2903 RepID=A0A0D3JW24_EMIH1|nr:hypothetical protein EMIHUDRAFT_353562 [Emiliania huxleyi CCMP1516]EOD27709.1 hypothetical protein EMIHUDRAFT_353562 [Emiliania huxleyi CCMP1516]|eukprot:XP_005780138.1 hypothetical protein EMIHUDRAFT_353562 [Emiliania huxleyi CCMP1516]